MFSQPAGGRDKILGVEAPSLKHAARKDVEWVVRGGLEGRGGWGKMLADGADEDPDAECDAVLVHVQFKLQTV